MHDLEVLRNGGYAGQGLKKLKLTCPLAEFPREILDFADSLEHLDLSGTGLGHLPAEFSRLRRLKVAFFSSCNFATFPAALASCPSLDMVAFRANKMAEIPEDALPPRLRWLILTDNQIRRLPRSIGRCPRLQKCMLAGNRLRDLPDEMADCKNLGLLRLSANQIDTVPEWLFAMPRLAFLSLAGNPCCPGPDPKGTAVSARQSLARVSWHDLEIGSLLGEGASGTIYAGKWRQGPDSTQEVAVKLFRGNITSDGTPADEMAACVVAGSHPNLIDTLAVVENHPEGRHGLLMQLIPPHYAVLGLPPSLDSCTRDCFVARRRLDSETGIRILKGVAAAARHLHSLDVAHCDLYAHNILVDPAGAALLGDFGAATCYGEVGTGCFERLEVLAFAFLLEDIMGLVGLAELRQIGAAQLEKLQGLRDRCSSPEVTSRPVFSEVLQELEGLQTAPLLAN